METDSTVDEILQSAETSTTDELASSKKKRKQDFSCSETEITKKSKQDLNNNYESEKKRKQQQQPNLDGSENTIDNPTKEQKVSVSASVNPSTFIQLETYDPSELTNVFQFGEMQVEEFEVGKGKDKKTNKNIYYPVYRNPASLPPDPKRQGPPLVKVFIPKARAAFPLRPYTDTKKKNTDDQDYDNNNNNSNNNRSNNNKSEKGSNNSSLSYQSNVNKFNKIAPKMVEFFKMCDKILLDFVEKDPYLSSLIEEGFQVSPTLNKGRAKMKEENGKKVMVCDENTGKPLRYDDNFKFNVKQDKVRKNWLLKVYREASEVSLKEALEYMGSESFKHTDNNLGLICDRIIVNKSTSKIRMRWNLETITLPSMPDTELPPDVSMARQVRGF